jgi:hypothetical protein
VAALLTFFEVVKVGFNQSMRGECEVHSRETSGCSEEGMAVPGGPMLWSMIRYH